jgi:hypothetical protein
MGVRGFGTHTLPALAALALLAAACSDPASGVRPEAPTDGSHMLTAQVEGPGTIEVPSLDLTCSDECTVLVGAGVEFEATAKPDTGKGFVGWQQDCGGHGTCSAEMSRDMTIRAVFADHVLSLRVEGDGEGTIRVVPPDANCSDDCNHGYQSGINASLTVTPGAGTAVKEWGGACGDQNGRYCQIQVNGHVNVLLTLISPPVANDDAYAMDEDTTLNVGAGSGVLRNDSDPGGGSLRATLVSQTSKGSVELASDGSFRYTPDENENGTDTFRYSAVDSNGNSSDPATVTVTIGPVEENSPPVAEGGSYSTQQDQPVEVTLHATDADGDPLTYEITDGPQNGSLSGTGNKRTYTPSAGYTGDDKFRFRANDGADDSEEATIDITVREPPPVNVPPVAEGDSYSTQQDQAVEVTLHATDADGDPLTYEITDGPQNGSLSGTGNKRTYTPSAGYTGDDQFRFRVNDGTDDSNEATIDITVEEPPLVNAPPVALDGSASTFRDQPVEATLSATDLDGDNLTYEITAGPQHGSLSGTEDKRTYTPNAGYTGNDQFRFRASDGTADSNQATIEITVKEPESEPEPANSPPVAQDDSATTKQDQPVGVTLQATDPDGDDLTYSITAEPAHGTLAGSAPELTYTPEGGYVGSDLFRFVANDGEADSNEATVNVTVEPAADDADGGVASGA